MNNLLSFTRHLEKPVLCNNKIYTLKLVGKDFLHAQNGSPELTLLAVECTKILVSDKSEILKNKYDPALCIVEINGEYVPGDYVIKTTFDETEFIKILCDDSGITPEQLETIKTRQKPFVWARQIHMAIRHKLMALSQTQAGIPYGLDHCTVIHAVQNIKNLLITDRWFREKYKNTFSYIRETFKDQREFNLNYLDV